MAVLVASTFSVGTVGLWLLSDSAKPRAIGQVGSGSLDLQLPLMTGYANPPGSPGTSGDYSFSFATTTVVTFAWTAWADRGTLVELAFVPTDAFTDGLGETFRISPGAAGWAGSYSDIEFALCRVDYTVTKWAGGWPDGSRTGLRVEYTVTLLGGLGQPNSPGDPWWPTALDLRTIGSETISSGGAGSWALTASVHDPALQLAAFHNTAGRFRIDAGSEGGVRLTLSSRFAWGDLDEYEITVRGQGPGTWTRSWAWDLRFGSILIARAA